jgi:hypothetical protein
MTPSTGRLNERLLARNDQGLLDDRFLGRLPTGRFYVPSNQFEWQELGGFATVRFLAAKER